MAAVGLFYVGAVLIVNGLMLIGRLDPREAAPLNFFVGGLQVLTPTVLLIQAGTPDEIFGAFGLYLFGFTYLWVGLNGVTGWPGGGLGWFSAFVSVAAIAIAVQQATHLNDPAFTVIWLCWAVLWGLFFLVLGLNQTQLTMTTGWVALVQGIVTAAVPGYLLVVEQWRSTWATGGAIAAVVAATVIVSVLFHGRQADSEPAGDSSVAGNT